MSTEPAVVLQLHEVTKSYPGINAEDSGPLQALPAVTLALPAGTFGVVSGRSGSGKTTLLQIAAGLLPPSSGTVRWDGTDITDLDDTARSQFRRRHLGIIFQDAGLISTLTAAENVALSSYAQPRRHRRGDPARVSQLLSDVGLQARRNHLPRQLSGGERQRVALARALYPDPRLVLVDEPTASLDRRRADDVIRILHTLCEHGTTVLVASHDPVLTDSAQTVLRLEAASVGTA